MRGDNGNIKAEEFFTNQKMEKMKDIDKWVEWFRKIWETRFNQLDNLLSIIKKQKK